MMGITRRVFNFILSCLLIGRKEPKQDSGCLTLADKDIDIEVEPEFEILAYHKPDRAIVYNIIKSGRKGPQQIRDEILSRAKVVYRR